MKKFLRGIAVLIIGLAILILSAAYTSKPVGEKEMYLKVKPMRSLAEAPVLAREEYHTDVNRVSQDLVNAEKVKADAAYQKQQEEAKLKQANYAKWVKQLKKKYTGKLVAFTFDDGPGKHTARLLKGLKKRDAHVTFMLLGSCASGYGNVVKQMIKDGHQIGNHSWNHPNLAKLKAKKINEELDSTLKLIRKLGYKGTCVVRPPYGSYNNVVKKEADAPIILWNVDTEDWRHKGDVKTIYKNIMRDAHDGAIILLHDIYGSSVDAALKAMDKLEKEGYQFVTVEELFAIRGVKMKDGKIYYNAPAGDKE